MKAKHFWRRFGKILLGIVVALLITVVLLLVLLQTGFVRNRLARMLEQQTATTAYQLRITDLGGFLPWRLHIGELVLHDASGPYLGIEQLQLHLDLGTLLRQRRLSIDQLSAQTVVWQRLPQALPAAPEATAPPPAGDDPPAWRLPDFSLNHFEIKTLVVSEPLVPTPARLRVTGSIIGSANANADVTHQLELLVEPVAATDLRVAIQARLQQQQQVPHLQITAKLTAAAADPWLASWLKLPPSSGALTAELQGSGPLDQWSGNFNLALADAVAATVSIDGAILPSPDVQIQGQWQSSAAFAQAMLGDAALAATARFALHLSPAELTLQQLQVQLAEIQLAATGGITWQPRQINAAIQVDAAELHSLGKAFNQQLAGELAATLQFDYDSIAGQRMTLALQARELLTPLGHFEQVAVDLRIHDMFVQPQLQARLQLGPGTIVLRATADIKQQQLQATAELDRLRLALLRGDDPDIDGELSGSISIAGAWQAPAITTDLQITQLRFPGIAAELPPATFIATAGLTADNDQLQVAAELQGLTPQPLAMHLQLPLQLQLWPAQLQLPPDQAIAGSLRGNLPLALLQELPALDDHGIAGNLEFELELHGTLQQPTSSGSIDLHDGYYLNYASGTVLDNIRGEFRLDNQQLFLEQLSATDSGGGSIRLHGNLELAPRRNWPYSLELTLRQATLVRTDTAVAAFSGQLNANGTSEGAQVRGNLELAPAELRIPRATPEIIDLEVREIGRDPDSEPPPVAAAVTRPPWPVELDVGLNFGSRVFLRGRGLTAELQGQLDIGNQLAAPAIVGVVQIQRGSLTFLTQRFTFEEGSIRFVGAEPPMPTLRVVAITTADDLDIIVTITGQLPDLEMELSSRPPLPQDQVMARLLFGRTLENITALQALRLARALQALATGEDIVGIEERLRRILDVDRLELLPGDDHSELGTRLSVGTYVGDDVYIQVERGLGPDSGQIIIERELGRRTSIEGRLRETGHGGISIKWRWDY